MPFRPGVAVAMGYRDTAAAVIIVHSRPGCDPPRDPGPARAGRALVEGTGLASTFENGFGPFAFPDSDSAAQARD